MQHLEAVREDRLEPLVDEARLGREADQEPEEDARDGQHDQRPRHDRRRLVDVWLDLAIDAAGPPEREAHQPEHVEGCQARHDEADQPDPQEAVLERAAHEVG